MTEEKMESYINGLNRYGAVLVICFDSCGSSNPPIEVTEMTFEHVLNVQASEEVRLGDAAKLFFRELFAVRLVDGDEVHQRLGPINHHLRTEVLRMSGWYDGSPEDIWAIDYIFDCYLHRGSFPGYRFDGPVNRRTTQCQTPDYHDPFGDGSDDEDEEDTLNSELLLPQEYCTPDRGRFEQDVATTVGTLKPQRRVNMFSPIEQEE